MKEKLESPAILLVYGEGGHAEEMKRLLNAMPGLLSSDVKLLVITETGAKDIHKDITRFDCSEVRSKKQGIKFISLIKHTFALMSLGKDLLSTFDVRFLITTGPGLAVPVALIAKMKKIQILHVETCCRFYSKSITGFFMEKIADEFWVQNEELLRIYPHAKWCGRLL